MELNNPEPWEKGKIQSHFADWITRNAMSTFLSFNSDANKYSSRRSVVYGKRHGLYIADAGGPGWA